MIQAQSNIHTYFVKFGYSPRGRASHKNQNKQKVEIIKNIKATQIRLQIIKPRASYYLWEARPRGEKSLQGPKQFTAVCSSHKKAFLPARLSEIENRCFSHC